MTDRDSVRRGEARRPLGETPGFKAWAEEIVSILRARREEHATAVSGVEYRASAERSEPTARRPAQR
jgi:hypothetical protein